ncbi:MAG: NAD(P)H:quinone oxidoreductase [Antricoccus sp.]
MSDQDARQTVQFGDSTSGRGQSSTAESITIVTGQIGVPQQFVAHAQGDEVKVVVVYYSATGSVHSLAKAVAQGARDAGGSVRVVRVRETVPQDIVGQNPLWDQHLRATADVPIATVQDVELADVILLGSPTRFGNISSQLQTFIDTWGQLWGAGALQDKVFAGFTSSATAHGGQEGTIITMYRIVCHLGGIIVPPGYTDPVQFATGNPYGASHTSNNGQLPPTDDDLGSAWVTGHRATTIAAQLRRGAR